MSRIIGCRRQQAEEPEVDMVPIMNMFLVLIPFLLMAASFIDINAINTSIPILSQAEVQNQVVLQQKVTVVVELKDTGMFLYAISDSVGPKTLKPLEKFFKKEAQGYRLDQMFQYLVDLKKQFPASDTLLIIPHENVIYDTIIKTMDVARADQKKPLFPNVVLSGKMG